MTTAEYPPGPWHDEPDRIEWRTAAGLPAIVKRVRIGSLCGYVAVPPGHPLHGKEDCDVAVHGGITYAAGDDTGVWWFGFDAAHYGDVIPGIGSDGTYRSIAYMQAECESLAAQLVKP